MKNLLDKTYLQTLVVIIFTTCMMTGCKVGPDYYPPKNEVPDNWSFAHVNPETPLSIDPPEILWWEVFNDPLLNKYIQTATKYNNTLLAAEANIAVARAHRIVAAAPLYPQIGADFDSFQIFLSKNGPIDAFAADTESAGAAAASAMRKTPSRLKFYNTFIDASWELDVYGKTRRAIEAADAQVESAIEQRNDRLISIFGEISSSYIQLRSAQKQKLLIEKNIELLKTSADIITQRYQAGYSNLLDLEQINIQLNQAIATLPAVNTTIYRNIFSLSILTGELPETLVEELLPDQPLPSIPDCLSIGLRSELLRRRPDIREAERNLAQATANIGVAVAAFFPSFSLDGIMGLNSLNIYNLFSPGSKTWIYGGDINMPIFQGGKLKGNLRIAEAQTAALAFEYTQLVLNALEETETVLVSYIEDKKTTLELLKIVQANQRLTYLGHERFQKGLINELDFVNSELTLINSELTLLESETATLLDLVSLYKALGGGWQPFSYCLDITSCETR